MKRLVTLTMAVLLVFAFAFAASAANEYTGYYVSTSYGEAGKGHSFDTVDGLPVTFVAHIELRPDGTYEGLIFGGLISGTWRVMKSPKGNEFVGLKVIETVDKSRYSKDTLFMLVPRADNSFMLIEIDSDEQMLMEKRPGKFDFDKVVDEIKKHFSGEK